MRLWCWAGRPGAACERLIRQAGLTIAVRYGDGAYEVHFGGGPFGVRRVVVTWGRTFGVFSLRAAAAFRPAALPPELGLYLLARTRDAPFAAWHLEDRGDERFGFTARFSTFRRGVDAVGFRTICSGLCREVSEVDAGLRSKGLI